MKSSWQWILNLMKGFLGRTTTAFNYFIFRFFYAAILAVVSLRATYFFWDRRDTGVFKGLAVLIPFQGSEVSAFQIHIAGAVLFLSLLSLAVGWKPRLAAFVALCSYCNIFMPMGYSFRPYDDNLVFYNLLILCLAPVVSLNDFLKGQPLTTQVAAWPMEFVKINLAMVYFSAFISKLVNSGWAWADGATLQSFLYERYLMTGNSFGLFVAQHLWLCTVLSVVTLFAESTFWTVLIRNRLSPFVAVSGFGMHVGIYLLMSINFLRIFALSYLVFLPYDRIYLTFREWWAAGSANAILAVHAKIPSDRGTA